MLGPDSRLLTALLVAASAALLVATVRLRPPPVRLLAVRVLCGALTIVVAMASGVAAVNHFYGYYQTWGQLWDDFHGSTGNLGVITATRPAPLPAGRFGWAVLPGRLTGYSRRALVYLPPQYGQSRYARLRFPVVELFHGTPGTPLVWATELRIGKLADALLARHLIGPMVLVMPSVDGPGGDYQDCVAGPALKDETYLLKDVRADLLARYHVAADPYQWGAAGYSAGGYCAASLALRHRGSFGAAAVIDAASSPLALAERLTPGNGPLPAFWIADGARDPGYWSATVFAAALDRFEQVPFVKLTAGDTGNAGAAALPAALTWLWQQLAPPDLRVQFPVRSSAPNRVVTLPVAPVKRRHHHKAYPARAGQRVT